MFLLELKKTFFIEISIPLSSRCILLLFERVELCCSSVSIGFNKSFDGVRIILYTIENSEHIFII